jgi:putative ABC transport system ATP-binding protein
MRAAQNSLLTEGSLSCFREDRSGRNSTRRELFPTPPAPVANTSREYGAQPPPLMIQLRKLRKTYRTGDIETAALQDIDLEIKAGEFVSITGPSGCGKSTLLGILGLLDTASAGEHWFEGTNVAGSSESQLSRLRRGRIGFIFQSFNLIDDLSVAENIELALDYGDVSAKDRKARVQEAMERLGIAHRARHQPAQMSGGQQQRVAIARAVVSSPPLLLADEPTGNLDSHHGSEVMRILSELNRDGTTVVMVTHSVAHAASAHRTLSLLDGRVVGEHAAQT